LGEAAEPRTAKSKRPRLDAQARGILRRFTRDWILPRWRMIGLALCWTGGIAAANTGYPAIIKHSFDSLRQPGSDAAAALPWVLLGIVGVTACRGLFLYLYQTTATNVTTRMVTDVQKTAFAHLMSADFARLTRETTGRLVSRLTSDLTAINGASQAALVSVRNTVTVVAMVSVMFYYDWVMTLILLCGGPLAALPVRRLNLRLKSLARSTQSEIGSMTSRLTEVFSGSRLIKAFRLEPYAVRRLDENFEQVLRLRLKAVRARAAVLSLLEVLGGVAVAGTIAFAFWRIASGINTEGDFVAYVACIVIASQSLRSFGSVSNATSEGLAAAERVYELLDEKPAIVDRPGARPLAVKTGSIVFDDVSFAYAPDARAPAVRGLSMTVPGGEMVALVGRSGAGKSTIINLVPRLFDVSAGRILIDGQDIRDVTLASLRDAISVVSQDITLFDDTIRANIALGRLGAAEEEIVAAAKAAAAHDFIMAQPHGYDTIIGEGGLRLSGGQRQRIALARAILKDAPILLLDEATSALDTESESLVQAALARFMRHRTTLVIAHRLSTVQRAGMICVMDDGRLTEVGTHSELLARNGIYARLCRSQALLDLGDNAHQDGALAAPVPPTEAA
jgi:ATP-binding cassette, subfamily B, bacterial MsbA